MAEGVMASAGCCTGSNGGGVTTRGMQSRGETGNMRQGWSVRRRRQALAGSEGKEECFERDGRDGCWLLKEGQGGRSVWLLLPRVALFAMGLAGGRLAGWRRRPGQSGSSFCIDVRLCPYAGLARMDNCARWAIARPASQDVQHRSH